MPFKTLRSGLILLLALGACVSNTAWAQAQPAWPTKPVPEMLFETVIVSVRPNVSTPLSVTAPLPSVPVVPPLPIYKVELVVVTVAPL